MTRRRKFAWTVIALGILVTTFLAFGWHVQHSFSLAICLKGPRACHNRMPCVFTLGQILPGDWDHLVVFDMNASQQEIDGTVGEAVRRPDIQRLIVFMKGPEILRTVTEDQGFEHPEPAGIYFDRIPIVQNHFSVDRNSAFVMSKGAPSCDDCTSLGLIRPGEVVE